jgi:hypothetical protein
MAERPTGVTLLAAFMLLTALFAVIQLLLFGTLFSHLDPLFLKFVLALDLVSIVIFPLLAVGLWKMKKRAWDGVIIVSLIGVIISIPMLNILSFIINVIVLWYLFQPNIKSVFK